MLMKMRNNSGDCMNELKCEYVDPFLKKLDVKQFNQYQILKKDLLLHIVEDFSHEEWFELIVFMSKKYPDRFDTADFENLIRVNDK